MSYQYKNFSELDLERIKDSLKEYLSGQEAFAGFDFKGTAINALINLLAYNTQYNAFYLNMHASERFLSTAQRRENVVSLAKNLGYTPHGAFGAFGVVNVEISTASTYPGNKLTVPKHTLFKASTEDETFTLYTKDSQDLEFNRLDESNPSSVRRVFSGNLDVFEGKKFIHTFTLGVGDTGVTLPNKNVQTDKLVVNVTTGSLTEEWSLSKTFLELDSSSKVYFVDEVVGQKSRIYFGDDVISKKPPVGSSVSVTYFTTKGTEANGASDFSFADSIPNGVSYKILNPKDSLTGGSDAESMEAIRTNAPLSFESQNRAVTAQDFKNILHRLIPSAHTVSVWGGEEEVNEQRLGYVFLSWVTEEELSILSSGVVISRSPTEKSYVQNELRTKYATVTIFPEVKDPQFVFLKVKSKVYYDSTKSITYNELLNLVTTNVKRYYSENISKFQTTLRYSKLSTWIDNSSQYITSNDLTVEVYQEKSSVADASGGIVIGVPIKPNTLNSSYFEYTINNTTRPYAYFSDKVTTDVVSQSNEVYLWYREDGSDNPWKDGDNPIKVGTIDRETGILVFEDPVVFDITNAVGISASNRLVVSAEPKFKDIDFGRNLLAVLRDADINIQVIAD